MIHVTDDIQIAEHEIELTYFPSSGPGGQNVNRVATAAHLRFDAAASRSLPEDVKPRLRSIAGKRLSSDGVLIIKAQRFRSQERNREDAIDRLIKMLARAERSPRSRRPTAPGKQAIERRLQEKRHRAQTKHARTTAFEEE